MSKSLKNFTTIREALSRGGWEPRALRIVFLYGNWKDGIEITDSLVREGTSWEEKINVGNSQLAFIARCNIFDRISLLKRTMYLALPTEKKLKVQSPN